MRKVSDYRPKSAELISIATGTASSGYIVIDPGPALQVVQDPGGGVDIRLEDGDVTNLQSLDFFNERLVLGGAGIGVDPKALTPIICPTFSSGSVS